MKTAHEFARELLAGQDMPIAVPRMDTDDGGTLPPIAITEKAISNATGEETEIILICGEL